MGEDYDAKCEACHGGGKINAKACPVSKNNCVSCHMPKIELPGAHHKFTEHRIVLRSRMSPIRLDECIVVNAQGRSGFVVSHPFRIKKRKGWGTGVSVVSLAVKAGRHSRCTWGRSG